MKPALVAIAESDFPPVADTILHGHPGAFMDNEKIGTVGVGGTLYRNYRREYNCTVMILYMIPLVESKRETGGRNEENNDGRPEEKLFHGSSRAQKKQGEEHQRYNKGRDTYSGPGPVTCNIP